MAHLQITLLSSYTVTLDDLPLTTFPTDKVRVLLAYLAVESDRAHRRETLTTLLWPASSGIAARRSLRQALYRLRHTLGDHQAALPHLLVSTKEVQFNPASDHWLDVVEFEAHIAASRAHHPRGMNLCPDCVARLTAAVALYRGDFLSGFSLSDCPRFDWWQRSTEEACHRQAMEALTWLTDHYEAHGEYALLDHCTRREIELEPWRESAHRRLMRALALMGKRDQALHQYEVCCRDLAQELGVGPSAVTTELHRQIREGSLDMHV